MVDKLVFAVFSRPVIYDHTDSNYRNKNKKENAWKRISEEIGVPEEACRKKWKSLRDTYLKEKKKESAAVAVKKWKYSELLSFLDPFLSPCETSVNMDPGFLEQTAAYDPLPPGKAAAVAPKPMEVAETSGFGDGIFPLQKPESPLAGPATADASPAPAGPTSSSLAPPGTSSAAAGPMNPLRKKRRQAQEDLNMDREILQILKNCPKNPSATEHFLLSLVPMMEQLPPRRKEMVKMKIQAMVFEEVYGGAKLPMNNNRNFRIHASHLKSSANKYTVL